MPSADRLVQVRGWLNDDVHEGMTFGEDGAYLENEID